jgi:hypothetical protein
MTGEKNRGVSLEKLWKIDDKELSTPEHDELVIMLLDSDYLKKILLEHFGSLYCNIEINTITSEMPLTQGYNKFTFGFADVVVSARCCEEYEKVTCPYCNDGNVYSKDIILDAIAKKIEATCKSSSCHKKFVVTPDVVKKSDWWQHITFYIECKPNITSFGETLRQIQLYRSAVAKDSPFILFTPDVRFKKHFESQNITVISP